AAVCLCILPDRGAAGGIGVCTVADRGGVGLACSGPGLRMAADRSRAVVGGGAAGIRKRADGGRELAARQRGGSYDGCTHVGRVRALTERAGVIEIGVRVLAERHGMYTIGRSALADRGRIAAADLRPLADRGAVAVIGQLAAAAGCRVPRMRTAVAPDQDDV